jgi:hypothetical protein
LGGHPRNSQRDTAAHDQCCPERFGDSPEWLRRFGYPVSFVLRDGKRCSVVRSGENGIHELVERRTETVDSVSDGQSPLGTRERLENLRPQAVTRSLRVRFSDERVTTVELFFEEPPASVIEFYEVLYRPLNLRKHTSKAETYSFFTRR